MADSFASTFWVGFALVLLTFIPIAFLPRKKETTPVGDDAAAGAATPVIVH